mgnify:CR=1 FL=1
MAKKQAKYESEYVCAKLDEYTNNTEIPIIKEICYQEYWDFDYMRKLKNNDENIGSAIRRLLAKKEAQLEKLALTGQIKANMAIFSLKQLGWRDALEITGGDGEIKPLPIQFIKGNGMRTEERLEKLTKEIKEANKSD